MRALTSLPLGVPFPTPIAVEYSAALDLEAERAQSLRRLFRTLTPAAEASETVEVRTSASNTVWPCIKILTYLAVRVPLKEEVFSVMNARTMAELSKGLRKLEVRRLVWVRKCRAC